MDCRSDRHSFSSSSSSSRPSPPSARPSYRPWSTVPSISPVSWSSRMRRNSVSTSEVWPGVGPGEAPAFMRLVNPRMVLKVWYRPTAR